MAASQTPSTPQGGELFTKGPRTARDKLNMMWRVLAGHGLLPGENTTVQIGPLGQAVNVTIPKAAVSGYDPFQVVMRSAPGNPNEFEAAVNPDSDLLKSLLPSDSLSITGLGVWFPFIGNDLISLYITVANYVGLTATIQSYGRGNTSFDPNTRAWNGDDDCFVFDNGSSPPSQSGINLLIAYSYPSSTGAPVLIQSARDHLILTNCAIDGRPAIYPFPAPNRRYGITSSIPFPPP
jgi:hypothetical protein